MDQSFSTIPISTLRGDIKIPFDVYIMIRGKHVHYLRRGDSFEGERLTRLKEKNMKSVFILVSDKDEYNAYVQQSLEIAYNSDRDLKIRAEIIQGAQESRAAAVLDDPTNPKAYQLAKEGTEKYISFLLEQEKGLQAILAIQNLDGNLAHHGVSVSSMAVKIAARVGLTDSKFLSLMTLGALLHDYGHMVQPMDINRPLSHLAPSEKKTYQEHPKNGAEKLKALQHFDPMVIQIIQEHEEFADGTGFPAGLVEGKIARESQLVGLANQMDRLISFEKRQPAEALQSLLVDRANCFPQDDLNALRFILSEQGVVT